MDRRFPQPRAQAGIDIGAARTSMLRTRGRNQREHAAILRRDLARDNDIGNARKVIAAPRRAIRRAQQEVVTTLPVAASNHASAPTAIGCAGALGLFSSSFALRPGRPRCLLQSPCASCSRAAVPQARDGRVCR